MSHINKKESGTANPEFLMNQLAIAVGILIITIISSIIHFF